MGRAVRLAPFFGLPHNRSGLRREFPVANRSARREGAASCVPFLDLDVRMVNVKGGIAMTEVRLSITSFTFRCALASAVYQSSDLGPQPSWRKGAPDRGSDPTRLALRQAGQGTDWECRCITSVGAIWFHNTKVRCLNTSLNQRLSAVYINSAFNMRHARAAAIGTMPLPAAADRSSQGVAARAMSQNLPMFRGLCCNQKERAQNKLSA